MIFRLSRPARTQVTALSGGPVLRRITKPTIAVPA